MNLKLDQKVALVCASSAGIGKAIAKGLAEEGVNVSIFSRNKASIEAAYKEISAVAKGKVIFNVCDVSNQKELESVVSDTEKRLGSIDILINNQGGPAPGSIHDITDEQLESAISTNLKSVFYLTKRCLPSMKERKFGRIINILSVSGKEPLPGMLLSNVMRPAVLGFAKTLATEYASYGITVNSLLPSSVLTNRTSTLLQNRADKDGVDVKEIIANVGKSLPIGYIASPDEFAQMAVFLCSPNASYVSGTAIAVDGASSKSLY